jgi:hypothetical protein
MDTMNALHIRLPLLIIQFVAGLCTLLLLPGTAEATLKMPPLGNSGVAPWSVGESTPPAAINVRIVDYFGDTWPQWVIDYPYLTVSMEDYVLGVVKGELGNGPPYVAGWPYNASSWSDEVVKAQVIAARTWGSYHARWRTSPTVPSWRGVNNAAGDQVYRPYYRDMPAGTSSRYSSLVNSYKYLYLAYYDCSAGGKLDTETDS